MTARRTMFANAAFSAASAVLILAVGAAQARQPSMGPPPGRLIDVGGYKLHIHCVGEGAPTIVIDGGAGAWSIHYAHIQKALSGARVCTYDRAGLGWSDAGASPRTSERMVAELHTLLHRAGVAGPLILAGHSLGGYNVRIYQARYPEEVGALVLLDAAHEQQWERLPAQAKALTQASVAGLRKRGEQARAGQLRAEEITPPGVLVAHSPDLRDAYVAAMLTGKPYETLAAETDASFESARQVPARHRLGNLPLVVLTARRSFDAFKGSGIPVEEANTLWLVLQNELASLSDNSHHLFSDGHHRLHETDPDAVVSAIQGAIRAVRIQPEPPAVSASRVTPCRCDRRRPSIGCWKTSRPPIVRWTSNASWASSAKTSPSWRLTRRVHVKGRAAWIEQTRKINAAHRSMDRRHRKRAVVGDWIITEIEWAGTLRGEALVRPPADR